MNRKRIGRGALVEGKIREGTGEVIFLQKKIFGLAPRSDEERFELYD